MNFLKRLQQERGQGLAEYALILFMVLFAFWLGVKEANIGDELVKIWVNIKDCIGGPFSCSS
jgi:hypothetical protein